MKILYITKFVLLIILSLWLEWIVGDTMISYGNSYDQNGEYLLDRTSGFEIHLWTSFIIIPFIMCVLISPRQAKIGLPMFIGIFILYIVTINSTVDSMLPDLEYSNTNYVDMLIGYMQFPQHVQNMITVWGYVIHVFIPSVIWGIIDRKKII